jgi:hypothetical protein
VAKIIVMQNEKKKSVEETKRDLEASRIRFDRMCREKDVKEQDYTPAPLPSLNQDTLNIAIVGE